MLAKNLDFCPCGSGEKFYSCCEGIIYRENIASSPEQLMRSRYSAYVLKNESYLLKTWHKTTRPEEINLENDSTIWKKLKIISTTDNTVHFVAYFTYPGKGTLDKEKIFALTEKSDFIKDQNWFYLSGKEVNTIELSKSMLCPCKSGKKFKRCCEVNL